MRPFAGAFDFSRRLGVASTLFLLSAAVAAPAQADTLFGITGGLFAVKSESNRDVDDVIYQNRGFLSFDVSDFNGGTIGGESSRLALPRGRRRRGLRTVPSVYLDFVNVSGREIEQDTELQVVPISATARLFPLGRDQGVQPYVGGGIALLNWKYTESGEFVDFNNGNEVFRDTFTDKGNVTAPVVLGGVRFALSDAVLLGGEFRYQAGKADLDPSLGFAGDRLDLGGYTTRHRTSASDRSPGDR
jgi:opacity protein-like surface antigen